MTDLIQGLLACLQRGWWGVGAWGGTPGSEDDLLMLFHIKYQEEVGGKRQNRDVAQQTHAGFSLYKTQNFLKGLQTICVYYKTDKNFPSQVRNDCGPNLKQAASRGLSVGALWLFRAHQPLRPEHQRITIFNWNVLLMSNIAHLYN